MERVKLISGEQSDAIERRIATALSSHLDAPGLGDFRRLVETYVLAPGKRVRPQLTAWTYLAASGERTMPPALLDVAAGWELFHAFLLVHDDIIDASHKRRDRPALHVALASLDSNSMTFGTNLGIVAGDLLFSAAMCLWHDLEGVDSQTYRDLLKTFSKTACTTGFGQAIDICASHLPMDAVDQATLLREYHWKTAAYTFEGPMLSGAILAGLGADAKAAISRFALAIGQAYQLHNDLLDLSTPAHAGCDLVQGKRTVALLAHRATIDDRMAFDERLCRIAAGDDESIVMAESLRGEMLDGEAARSSRALIDGLLTEAGDATRDAALPTALSAGMASLLDTMTRQYFADA